MLGFLRTGGRGAGRGTFAALVSALLAAPPPARAASFDFVPAPQIDLNRVYRVDKATGEVTSCQYGLQEGSIGATLCFAAGEGAGPQAASEYGLVASRHTREAGVFRVNYRTGEMSICYVLEEAVVCTPQSGARGAAVAASAAPALPPRTGAPAPRP